jgi:hypothetical protein
VQRKKNATGQDANDVMAWMALLWRRLLELEMHGYYSIVMCLYDISFIHTIDMDGHQVRARE